MHLYVTQCHKFVWSAITAIETGTTPLLGSAMTDAQQLFDNCAIEVLTST